MNSEFFHSLELLEREYGISPDYMIAKTEEALVKACQKEYGGKNNAGQNSDPVIRVVTDRAKKDIKCYLCKEVVAEVDDPITQISLTDAKLVNRRMTIGKTLETEVKTKNLRRLSAGAAKSVIIQAIREAQKENQKKEFEDKREEIITATVTRIWDDTGDIEVTTGTGTLKLPYEEQIPDEEFDIGDKIMIYFSEVKHRNGENDITISRKSPGFIRALFRLAIPEISDGTVKLRHIAREAGSRTKVSVWSEDEEVDPVGACIGPHGIRINGILDELGGEKIDVVRWYEDKAEYIKSALAPADVISVEMLDEKSAHVVVAPDQLSLAIGAQGQNARLVAKLTNCRIDIKTE